MKIKSLLIGSAAALASATVVNAADAIVAAEPEAVEYVRVCDAFGTGFFYIPGTETCLRISGLARFEVGFSNSRSGTSDWDAFSRGEINFDARTETELGALRSFIRFRGDADTGAGADSRVNVHQAFIELGGFRAGKFLSWWDDGLSGETDSLANNALFNSVRYVYDAGSWSFGVSVDELENTGDFVRASDFTPDDFDGATVLERYNDNNVGISANLGLNLDGVNFALLGGYDTDLEEGAIRAILTAQLGPGTFGVAGVYASGANAYFAASEWALAAEYAVAINDRLRITPGVQWFGNLAGEKTLDMDPANAGTVLVDHTVTNLWTDIDAWQAGLTVDYTITSGLAAKVAVNYYDEDNQNGEWSGFVRLDRSF